MSEHPSLHSQTAIATPQAARYLTQLCKHFQHRCPVTLEGAAGEIGFSMGVCRLQAAAGTLTLALQASDPAGLQQLQDVIARHLLRFAFRETLQIAWIPVCGPDAASMSKCDT